MVEHARLLPDCGFSRHEELRQHFVAVLEGTIPEGAAGVILEHRIGAKFAKAELLPRAAFGVSPVV